MEQTLVESLHPLHTRAIDARHGYQEALDDAKGHGLTALFESMIALHTTNADELATAMGAAGGKPNDEGSFMSIVHRTIMDVRSMFGGLGVSVLPGLIDGESRNIAAYDDVLKEPSLPVEVQRLLTTQRSRIVAAVANMHTQSA